MKIQVNAQTNGGVWGYMITCWNESKLVAAQWFAEMPALPPNGVEQSKEKP